MCKEELVLPPASGLDLEHAPRRAGHCNLHFDQCSLVNGVTDHDYYEPVLQEAILYLTKGDVSEEHFAQFLRHLFSEANSNLE